MTDSTLTKRQRRAPADARTAWRAMTAEQRTEFLQWLTPPEPCDCYRCTGERPPEDDE